MRTKRVFIADVRDGVIPDAIRMAIAGYIRMFNGKRVQIIVNEHKGIRTKNQNSYYWKVLNDLVVPVYRETGHDWDADDVHEVIVAELGYTDVYFTPQGKPYTKRQSTRKFDSAKFSDFYTRFVTYCAQNLGIYIPDPVKEAPDYLLAM